jgi:hypothetical protein
MRAWLYVLVALLIVYAAFLSFWVPLKADCDRRGGVVAHVPASAGGGFWGYACVAAPPETPER